MRSTVIAYAGTVEAERREMTGRADCTGVKGAELCHDLNDLEAGSLAESSTALNAALGSLRKSRPLTSRQQMVLAFITEYLHDNGSPPTLREIGKHMGIRSTNGVNDHLRALERKGYLVRRDMLSRGIRVVGGDDPGTVATSELAAAELRTENKALVELLRRVERALTNAARLSPELVILLGDVSLLFGRVRS